MAGGIPLYTPFSQAATQQAATPPPPPRLFPVAPLLDLATGDVVLHADGSWVWADADTAWQQRLLQMVLVRRGSTPLYAPAIGTAFDLDALQIGRSAQQASIQADIAAAAAQDPYTARVDGFVFAWQAESLLVTFTATSQNGVSAQLTVSAAP